MRRRSLRGGCRSLEPQYLRASRVKVHWATDARGTDILQRAQLIGQKPHSLNATRPQLINVGINLTHTSQSHPGLCPPHLALSPNPAMSAFHDAVYAAVQEIPRGRVTTYGHIAALIGTRAPHPLQPRPHEPFPRG